jgi:secreted Zn-dependent insulinase-like peptidase
MDGRIESFLQTFFEETLTSMSDEALQDNKSAVIENLLEKPKNINKVTVILDVISCDA